MLVAMLKSAQLIGHQHFHHVASSCRSHLAQELPCGKILVGSSCINSRNGGSSHCAGVQQLSSGELGSVELAVFHRLLHSVLCSLGHRWAVRE